ncbi:hypothetical protein SEVIR_9G349901v4 [Setaria viridis]
MVERPMLPGAPAPGAIEPAIKPKRRGGATATRARGAVGLVATNQGGPRTRSRARQAKPAGAPCASSRLAENSAICSAEGGVRRAGAHGVTWRSVGRAVRERTYDPARVPDLNT